MLATVALAATPRTPSRTQIEAVMRRTVEVTDHSEHFATLGRLFAVTVGDGRGGTLTAVLGTRSPTADGYGQLVFFWHNGRFIPWADATIHVLSHVVSYGSSVFEGIRCYATPGGPAIFP